MKNTKTLRRISVIVLVVMLVTMCALGVTLARYTSTFSGTFQGSSTDWIVTVNDSAEKSFTITPDTAGLYPGMTAQKYTFVVKNGNTNLLVNVSCSLENVVKPEYMSIEITKAPSKFDSVLTNGETATIEVTVSWPFGESNDDTPAQGANVSFTLNIVAEQSRDNFVDEPPTNPAPDIDDELIPEYGNP